jgi:hypothetical protein
VKETKLIPAQPEHTIIVPATEAKLEEVIEWKCEPILASDSK